MSFFSVYTTIERCDYLLTYAGEVMRRALPCHGVTMGILFTENLSIFSRDSKNVAIKVMDYIPSVHVTII